MKTLLLNVGFILLSCIITAQEINSTNKPDDLTSGIVHGAGDITISASPNLVSNFSYETLFAGGIKLSVFMGKRFSFDSDIVFGKDYVHFGPGIIGLPLFLIFFAPGEATFDSDEGDTSFGSFMAKIVLMVCSAEHFAYHIPLNNNLEIAPYTSLLRFKQLSNVEGSINPDEIESAICFAIGAEMNTYFKNFVLSPYIDYNNAYNGSLHGLNLGVYLGYNFARKR